MKNRIRRKIGDIISIPLGDGLYGFGRVLEDPLIAFYDFSSYSQPEIEEIISSPIAFRVWVDHEPIVTGRWNVVGNANLEPELQEEVWFYKQDPITKELYLYQSNSNGQQTPAILKQCQDLERAAVWATIHVEKRLQDHFAGRENITVESFKSRLNA